VNRNSEPQLLLCVLQVKDASLEPTTGLICWRWGRRLPVLLGCGSRHNPELLPASFYHRVTVGGGRWCQDGSRDGVGEAWRMSWCSPDSPADAGSPAGAFARAAAAIWLVQVSSLKCIYANYLINAVLRWKSILVFLLFQSSASNNSALVIIRAFVLLSPLLCWYSCDRLDRTHVSNMPADACLLLVVLNPISTKSCLACISLDLNHAPVYVFCIVHWLSLCSWAISIYACMGNSGIPRCIATHTLLRHPHRGLT
jgi:hypothetical protein